MSIKIGKSYVIKDKSKSTACLITPFEMDGISRDIIVTVAKEYRHFLCFERSDAILIGCLKYAMVHGHDIECEVPVTEELLYSLRHVLIPTFCREDKRNHHIRIYASSAPALLTGNGVGTGMSCGVDSFYSALSHIKTDCPEHDITHLVLHNVGSIGESYRNAGRNYTSRRLKERALDISKELGLPLIQIDSNFQDVLPQDHIKTHTFSSAFAVYSLQKLWKTYYYASAYPYSEFNLSDNSSRDSACADPLILRCLSTPGLQFWSEGAQGTRADKICFIAENPIVQHNLHVCFFSPDNCGVCEKCKRTLLSLDAIGVIDKYDKVFDLQEYYSKISEHYRFLCEEHVRGNHFYDMAFEALYPKHKKEFDGYMKDLTFDGQLEQRRLYSYWLDLTWMMTDCYKSAIDQEVLRDRILASFEASDIHSIGFFGRSDLSNYLFQLLQPSKKLEILYIVEDYIDDYYGLPIYPRATEHLPYADIIIVTDMPVNKDTQKMLLRDHGLKSVLAQDIFKTEVVY